MPYKIWSVNEILTAADMNDYVGNQTVLSFAGTAARATAIGTPVEGMVSYVGSGVVEVYAGTATGWTQISGGGGVTVGTAAPDSPSDGDLWWDSDDGELYLYYNDDTSSQWVAAAGPSVTVAATAPTGYEGQLWLDSTDGSMYTFITLTLVGLMLSGLVRCLGLAGYYRLCLRPRQIRLARVLRLVVLFRCLALAPQ
jgi:hypothetical protein